MYGMPLASKTVAADAAYPFHLIIRLKEDSSAPWGFIYEYVVNGEVLFTREEDEYGGILGLGRGSLMIEMINDVTITEIEALLDDGIEPLPEAFWTNLVRATETI